MNIPADYEPENAATDGSREMELADLRRANKLLQTRLQIQEGSRQAALQIVDRILQLPEVHSSTQIRAMVRETRMVLDNGMALTQQQRVDDLIEEWLQDPDRNVYGLAAELADVLARRT